MMFIVVPLLEAESTTRCNYAYMCLFSIYRIIRRCVQRTHSKSFKIWDAQSIANILI